MNFQLEVVSIEGSVFSGEVKEVILPGVTGELTALARHMSFVTPLTVGEVVIKTPDKVITLSIGKGVFSFDSGVGRLLIEDASLSDDITEERALEAKKKAEELLEKGIKGEEKQAAMYQLRKSLVDLKIARKSKRKAAY
jgi:F-type H+-transporting ATPase subunit epsilon